jgi:hypothetical protein
MDDPFLTMRESPFLLALMDLTPRERRLIARQAAVLSAIFDIDPLDSLELLSKVGVYLIENGILPNSKFIAGGGWKRL